MASVVEGAVEFITTPYVFAKGSVEYRLKRFYISLSSSIMTDAPKIIISIMALGSALSTNFGTAKISVRSSKIVHQVLICPRSLANLELFACFQNNHGRTAFLSVL